VTPPPTRFRPRHGSGPTVARAKGRTERPRRNVRGEGSPLLEWPPVPRPQPRGFALSARPVLALDLGGTQIRAAVVLPTGDRLGRVAVPTPVAEGPAAIVRACAEALVAVRDSVPRALRAELAAIGISSPGPVDPFRGVVVEPPNLGPDFRDIPLAAEMADALGLRAVLDRDTNVAALAEHAYGAARDCADFLYLTVSTGIGGAIVAEQPGHR